MEPSDIKRALVDADILVYRVGFTTEQEEEGIARWRLDEMINIMGDKLGVNEFVFYLSSDDKSNFRYQMFPEYKAHRKERPKPKHYQFLKDYLVSDYFAEIVTGQEADDALGIALMADPKDSVICTIDKDLDQIPGWHYNFVKERLYYISELEGWRSFYHQCLVGDKSTDNIEGCPRIGEVKSNRMLEGCESEDEMFQTVLGAYQKAFPTEEEAANRLFLAGSLLWIRRRNGQPWTRPSGEVVSKESLLDSFETEESTSDTSKSESLM